MNVVVLKHKKQSQVSEESILNDEMRRWAQKRGVVKLELRYEHFADYLAASGKEYRDYCAAFRNACRQDWARLGAPAKQSEVNLCAKCRKELDGGYVLTQAGKLCNSCWVQR